MPNDPALRNLSGAYLNVLTLLTPARAPVPRLMTAPHVPMQRVRAAALRAVEATSLRHVARQAGLSPPGLRHFLDGGEPQRLTARKLVEWYVRDAATRHELDEDTANAALSLLVERLPEAEAARERILAMLRDTYRKADTLPPRWLKG